MNILLSHTYEETPAASVLKQWIESSLDRDVQVSSEAAEIELDDKRLATIDQVLGETQVLLLLCSDESIGRPWISFEAGCAWFKGVAIMAVCHAGYAPENLPPPLDCLEAFDLSDPASCQALMEALARQVKRKRVPRIDGDLMVAELAAAMDGEYVPAPVESPPRAARSSAPAEPAAEESNQPIEVRLLSMIKRLPDFTCTATQLAADLGEQQRMIQHFLDKLVSSQLLTQKASTLPTDPETRYAFTERAQEYLAKYTR